MFEPIEDLRTGLLAFIRLDGELGASHFSISSECNDSAESELCLLSESDSWICFRISGRERCVGSGREETKLCAVGEVGERQLCASTQASSGRILESSSLRCAVSSIGADVGLA